MLLTQLKWLKLLFMNTGQLTPGKLWP
jgi:hypothetical protein